MKALETLKAESWACCEYPAMINCFPIKLGLDYWCQRERHQERHGNDVPIDLPFVFGNDSCFLDLECQFSQPNYVECCQLVSVIGHRMIAGSSEKAAQCPFGTFVVIEIGTIAGIDVAMTIPICSLPC
jgi:hypothetical protein